MAQRNRGNPWGQGQGSQSGGKQAKSAKKNSPVSPPPPVKSAEERFRQAQAKLQKSVQKHLDQELELSSEEEDLETDTIYDSVIQNYAQIGGKNEDLGKTQNFLENIFRSDVAICLICIATIKRVDKIWSCGSCYGFFHLLCIQRWGKDSIAHQKLAEEERIPNAKKEYHWPCPKCRKNYTAESVPQRYECFCHQVIDPPYQPWLVPHSCGQVCGKDLVPSCGHTCLLLCHPGPCPPCPKMVRAKCYCSNGGEKMVRCCYKEWSCGQKCSKKLACQKHKCEAVCHPGACPACPKTSMMSCDCKSQSRMTACAELSWKCDKVCGKSLDCGKHSCELVCHKGDCGPCPRTLPRACPCGAEEDILPCTQEVATCGSTCGKLLDCGLHTCNQRCHRGGCGACMEFLEKHCRCGLHKKEIACIKEYLCDTKCKGIRDCGVHPCNRKCCDGRCPPCEKICGKTLRCGQHKCASVCHRGPCYPCEQTKQISCRCGSTVVTVPCGTHKRKKNLKCNKLCLIPPDCHHEKREEHKCHLGPCPPCRQICRKPRDCGHPCSLNCHSSVVVSAVPNYKPATPWDRVTATTEHEDHPCPHCELQQIDQESFNMHFHWLTDQGLGQMEVVLEQEDDKPLETPGPGETRDGVEEAEQLLNQVTIKPLSGAQRRKALKAKILAEGGEYKRPPKKKPKDDNPGSLRPAEKLVGQIPADPIPPTQSGGRGGRFPLNYGASGSGTGGGKGSEGNNTPGTSKLPRESQLDYNESTPAGKPLTKKPSQEYGAPNPWTGRAAAERVKIAVFHREHPVRQLTEEDAAHIQWKLLTSFASDQVEVHFSGVFREGGALGFVCEDRQTADWLMGAVPGISLGEGTDLVARPWSELISTARVVFRVPELLNQVQPLEVLRTIKQQNSAVDTREWRIVSSISAQRGRTFVVVIPEQSLRVLRGINMTIYLGFECVTIRVIRPPRNSPQEQPCGSDGGGPSGEPATQ